MENDSAKTIKDQWGIDPLEGVTLNEIQQTIVDEALDCYTWHVETWPFLGRPSQWYPLPFGSH